MAGQEAGEQVGVGMSRTGLRLMSGRAGGGWMSGRAGGCVRGRAGGQAGVRMNG